MKNAIATRYGVDTVMPEETRIGVEILKKGESDKRKKAWEDKEGPPAKKIKKSMTGAGAAVGDEELGECGNGLMLDLEGLDIDDVNMTVRREREAQEKAEQALKAKEETERLAAEKKKKKPIRYPTEDLDVTFGDKEKKAGMRVKKLAPSRSAMPFGTDNDTNEAFLMAWNFLVVYGCVVISRLPRAERQLTLP